ncbi:MAG TPA: carboxypeptidase-like regulatory domain-containing protein [Acidimicrobiales bacterium]|nr:carboxypeptidase-like regulatory domain-containing protein [Acidimicrobiales bacterium]
MRVELLTPRVEAKPGTSCEVELEVYNTGEVIDSVTSRVLGHAFDAEQRPPTLSLFPESGDRLTVSFRVPDDLVAGRHSVPIEVVSTFQTDDVAVATLDLDVQPVVSAKLALTPSDITAGKRAKFAVGVTNDGNVPLDLTLTGNDLERVLRFRFEPLFVHVEPGETAYASGLAVGKRPFFGSPVPRSMTVFAWGNGLDLAASGRFVQKPRIPRGFLTFLALAGVVGIWAAVLVLGAGLVLDKDAPKKTVPATFLIGNVEFDAAMVAGSLGGQVTATTDGTAVERITVEAFRQGDDGSQLVGSAATGDDGSWELASVLPGRYHLRFSAPGFVPIWYPGAPTEAGAQEVRVQPVTATDGVNIAITGEPGSIAGAIAAGEQTEVFASIIVRAVVNDVVGDVLSIVETQPDGSYIIEGLATPGTFELGIVLAGFDQQSLRVTLGGGEQTVVNTVNMAAAAGTLSGTVFGPDGPLGAVTVTLSGSGQSASVSTPTDGDIGIWVFTGLPTPGTYLLTFELPGFGTQTIAIDLLAGQTREGILVDLPEGTGQVSGRVTDADGNPLGGVTVTVTGGGAPISTTTLTTGDVGAYAITDLPTPGRFTLTFTADGYASVTVGVELAGGGSAGGVDAQLARSTSSVIGTVRAGGAAIPGATIVLTDGQTPRSTVSADDPAGGYRFDGLPAGRYTLTISAAGHASRTVLVTLGRGETVVVDADLVPS